MNCHEKSGLKFRSELSSCLDSFENPVNGSPKSFKVAKETSSFDTAIESPAARTLPPLQLAIDFLQSLIVYLSRLYGSLINFIFRSSFFDQFRATSCQSDGKADAHAATDERPLQNYRITEVADHLRFNPFILEGYRSNLNFKQSLLSLFYLHNESTNIYSHAFAFVYFAIFMPKRIPWDVIGSNWLCMCFAISMIFATIAPWFGSTIYHLFMNYRSDSRNGPAFYNKLLSFDVLGIWISQTFGALLLVYMSVIDFRASFKWFYLSLYLLLSVRSLYDVLYVGGRLRRRLGFSSLVLMRFISLCLRMTYSNKLTNYNDIILIELYPILGALISAWHVPEALYPGTFDLFLNSHNLMHLLVVLGAFHLYSQGVHDLILLSKY